MTRVYHKTALVTAGIVVVLILSLWASVAGADSMAPQIDMNAVLDKVEPGVIKAQVFDDTMVANVKLYYRKPGETTYNSINLKVKEDNIYYRELEKDIGLEGKIEYYLIAQDTAGNETSLPAFTPEENPMNMSLDGMVNMSAEGVFLSSPEPGVVYDSGEQLVMISFYQAGTEIDFNTIRLKVDKVDRTREVNFAGNTLIWEPRRPFPDGVHEIEAVVKDVDGDPIGPNIWSFQVKTKLTLPLGAEGDFYLGVQHDERSGGNSYVPLWNNKVDMALRGQAGGVNWKAGVMLSSEETAFLTSETLPNRQPINRYFFEGRTRHWQVRVGDSNPIFSDLSLKGIFVRGLNMAFKSNRFNANVVYGYNKRDIDESIHIIESNCQQINTDTFVTEEGDTLSTAAGNLMAIQNPTNLLYNIYQFDAATPKRQVAGLKMDVSPIRNRFATWKLGFNFFSAKDDSTSLEYTFNAEDNSRYRAFQDSSFYTDYKPKQNWVGTIETSLRFNNNKSEISAEFGGTLATENMFSYVTPEIKNELPTEIDESLFLFNGTTQSSFDKVKIKDSLADGAKDAILSVYKFRFNTEVPIPMTNTRLKTEAYRIPTHYISLGNPQQKTDIGGYKIDLRTRVYRDQLSFNLGYNSYSDNLESERKQYNSDALDLKDLTKDTNITNFSVSYNPRQFRDYSPSVSVGYRIYDVVNDLDLNVNANDPFSMIDTSTNTLMLNLGGTLPVGMQRHAGMLSISNMSISDNRPLVDYDLSESNNLTVMFNLNSQINPLPLGISASLGHTTNKTYLKNQLGDAWYERKEVATGITMLNLSGTYKWFRDKRLKTTTGIGYIASGNGESGVYEIDNNKVSLKVQADYQLNSVTSVGGLVRFINYTDNVSDANDYNEPVIGVNLRSAF